VSKDKERSIEGKRNKDSSTDEEPNVAVMWDCRLFGRDFHAAL